MRHPLPAQGGRQVRHWLRQTIFTMVLTGLVAGAAGANWQLSLAGLALSAASFGFFYLAFPGGVHFGLTMANFLAVYGCMFAYFREANFPDVRPIPTIVALILPVAMFLLRCLTARRRVAAMIRARRQHELTHLPRLTRWLPGVVVIAAGSFALPRLGASADMQDLLLIVGMAVIGGLVAVAEGDVVLLMLDVALVFETMAKRVDRLVMPMMAFLSGYSLVIIVFACLFRIAERSLGVAQFLVHGHPGAITFSDALYFSVITISTVGYGDISPAGALVRALASLEVVAGLMMLLFGVAEIMRGSGPESEQRRRFRSDSEHDTR